VEKKKTKERGKRQEERERKGPAQDFRWLKNLKQARLEEEGGREGGRKEKGEWK